MLVNVSPSVAALTVADTSMTADAPGAIDAISHVGLTYVPSPDVPSIVSSLGSMSASTILDGLRLGEVGGSSGSAIL